MAVILQDPQNPDHLSRLAGKTIYDTPVGCLRRYELYRLGNAWGMNFPSGATKDYMLPFFKQLESEGKNPLRPPAGNLDELVRRREVTFSPENHSETASEEDVAPQPVIEPAPKSDFEAKLEAMHMGPIRRLCRLRGIPQTNKDRKQDLVARIVAAANDEGNG